MFSDTRQFEFSGRYTTPLLCLCLLTAGSSLSLSSFFDQREKERFESTEIFESLLGSLPFIYWTHAWVSLWMMIMLTRNWGLYDLLFCFLLFGSFTSLFNHSLNLLYSTFFALLRFLSHLCDFHIRLLVKQPVFMSILKANNLCPSTSMPKFN